MILSLDHCNCLPNTNKSLKKKKNLSWKHHVQPLCCTNLETGHREGSDWLIWRHSLPTARALPSAGVRPARGQELSSSPPPRSCPISGAKSDSTESTKSSPRLGWGVHAKPQEAAGLSAPVSCVCACVRACARACAALRFTYHRAWVLQQAFPALRAASPAAGLTPN